MSSQETFTGKAIVTHGPLPKNGWKMEEVSTTPNLKDDECIVEIVASGICHTDVLFGTIEPPAPFAIYPSIKGHEGSGYVRSIGSAVTNCSVGDPVLLSFTYCGSCVPCRSSNRSYCEGFGPLNFGGHDTFTCDGKPIKGSFFGQSCFAKYSVVNAKSIVNVKGLVTERKELELFAPLGCGFQTGSGTVINAARAGSEDTVVVLGLGGVGLSAIMGAKILGCRVIIGVDRVESRMGLAKEMGATHVINSDQLPEGKTVVDLVREICDGVGAHLAVDTTGAPPLIKMGVEMIRPKGMLCQVGSAPFEFNLEISAFRFMCAGKTYRGVIEGESYPPEYVPKLIQWYREGKFPVDKLVKFFPAEDYEKALHAMHTGETVKPVLLWS